MILQSMATNCSGSKPFKVPWVPTGMKTGVSTTEWGKVISATLALEVEHLASTLNARAEPSLLPILYQVLPLQPSVPKFHIYGSMFYTLKFSVNIQKQNVKFNENTINNRTEQNLEQQPIFTRTTLELG